MLDPPYFRAKQVAWRDYIIKLKSISGFYKMKLTSHQKTELVEKGFTKIRGVAGQKQVNVALRAINHSIGNGMDPEKVPVYRATTYCPELTSREPVLDLLYETPAWEIVESAIGTGKIKLEGSAQIALRFPVMQTPGEMHPHIDGMYSANNRVRKGAIFSFTALAGILLSDVPNRFWGNFTGWPGSHRQFADYFREHGTAVLKTGLPPVKLSQPEQILAKAGDMILCHYLTAHTVVVNVSPYIRYAVFFRIRHTEHSLQGEKVFTDVWHEWPGIRAIL